MRAPLSPKKSAGTCRALPCRDSTDSAGESVLNEPTDPTPLSGFANAAPDATSTEAAVSTASSPNLPRTDRLSNLGQIMP